MVVRLLLLLLLLAGCGPGREVVVYTSVDQVYSEPILRRFERQSGIRVKAVFDVEAAKTVGLVNRLLAERERPRCDVFWNSEVVRTIVLKRRGVLAPYRSPSARDVPEAFRDPEGYWAGVALRARVLIYNRELLPPERVPRSILELARPAWRGKVAMAYPLFGTTATHVAALFVALGSQRTEALLRALRDNALILDGNAMVRDAVVEGRVPLGLTDTDDVNVALAAGKPVGMAFPRETLLIPHTAVLVRGCPHPEEARRLIDYLLSPEVERELLRLGAAQFTVRGIPPQLEALRVNWEEVASSLEEAMRLCRLLFGG